MASVTGTGNMKIGTIEIDNDSFSIEEYEQESLEFLDNTYNGIPILNKIGNRNIYHYKMYRRSNVTLATFDALYASLLLLNGTHLTFTPHKDTPGTTYSCYFETLRNRYSEYPIEFVDLKLTAVEVD